MKNHDYLRNEPFFWSRLGFCYDPPRFDKNNEQIIFSKKFDKYRKFHNDFKKAGIKYHTTIVSSGWVGDGVYDYRLTDLTLDELLKDNPDILYMPRVKLNAPPDWCKNHPADVFVYDKSKDLTLEEISAKCGTLEQDYFGFNCPGYAVNGGDGSFVDDRVNYDGKIGLQSFSSPQWIKDASIALEKFIEHVQNGPYAKQIIGYHIAYGQLGETCLWGGWREREEENRGDFGKVNTQEFIKYGLAKHKTEETLLKKWGFNSIDEIEVPSTIVRDSKKDSLRELFFDDAHNMICRDYNEFSSLANAKACEAFCKVVKDKTNGEAAAGIFYGYIYTPHAQYMSHCGLDYVLNSPYIDFLASPNAYFRHMAGEPSGEQGPSYSINRKKVWLDEIDNKTHLDERPDRANNLFETRSLLLREGVKNMSTNQGFWWMDLGEGWYDMPEIMGWIKEMSDVQSIVNKKPHKSEAEILIVVDEKALMSMSVSYGLVGGLHYNMHSELKLCGAPVDTLRLQDLYEIDLSQYKLIVFANTFMIDDEMRKILKDNAKGKTYVWNYAAGILSPDFALSNVKDLTGFDIKEFSADYEDESFGYSIEQYNLGACPKLIIDFPLFSVETKEGDEVMSHYPTGEVMCAKTEKDGGVSVLCAFPSIMMPEFRKLAEEAGCKMFAPMNCTVYGDNRLIGVYPREDMSFTIDFGDKTVDGEHTKKLDMKAKGAEYFVYDSTKE